MSWKDVEGNASGEKMAYTKFKEGTTRVRIIGDEPFSFWSHYMVKQRTSVTCPGKGCPICKVIDAAKKNGGKSTEYNTSRRHAITIWNYETERQEILISSKTLFGQLLSLMRDEAFGDLSKYDVKIKRTGEGTDTTYMVIPCAPTKFEHEDEIEDVDIENMLKAPTHEEILMLMEGKTWDEINGNSSEDESE